jgi:hypothetical protein
LSWIGVSDESLRGLKCALADGPRVDHFKAFGTSILGGAIIGVVIRSSGSWFFGKPIQPGPGHWFWNRFDQAVKTGGQGSLRGALFAGTCETILAGGNLLPFRGLIGQDFNALSAATALGALTALAANPYVWMMMGEDPTGADVPEAQTVQAADPGDGQAEGDGSDGGAPGEGGVPSELGPLASGARGRGRFTEQIRDWAKSGELHRGVRYRLAPGVLIVGIGASVGVVIYNGLQDEDEQTAWSCTANGTPVQAPAPSTM